MMAMLSISITLNILYKKSVPTKKFGQALKTKLNPSKVK